MSAIMFDLFKTVRVILKFDSVRIDNNVARLHYKLTVIFLVVFSLLVTSKQYFGDPIHCHLSKENGLNLDTYCWVFSTFTVKKHLSSPVGKKSVQAGVGTLSDNDEIITQKYYQWVCFVLAFQAAAFYIPRHLWKTWEGGRLKMLVGDLGLPIISSEWTMNRKKMLLKYIVTNRNTHTLYICRFVFCEILNFINVVAEIYLIDLFLGGTFTSYGPAVLLFTTAAPGERIDPMAHVFPKVAKCTYRNVGPSGSIQTLDALCVLPLNILNEKIFVLLWFWFVILSIISLISILYRFLMIQSRTFRKYLLMAQARRTKKAYIDIIVEEFNFGDWFMLNMLGKNINPVIFKELINEIALFLIADKRTQAEMIADFQV